ELAACLGPRVIGREWRAVTAAAGLTVRADLLGDLARAGLVKGGERRWRFLHPATVPALLEGMVRAGRSGFATVFDVLQPEGEGIRDPLRTRDLVVRWSAFGTPTVRARVALGICHGLLGDRETGASVLKDVALDPEAPTLLRLDAASRLPASAFDGDAFDLPSWAEAVATTADERRLAAMVGIGVRVHASRSEVVRRLEASLMGGRGDKRIRIAAESLAIAVQASMDRAPVHIPRSEAVVLRAAALGDIDLELDARHTLACTQGWSGDKRAAIGGFLAAAEVARRAGRIVSQAACLSQATICAGDIDVGETRSLALASLACALTTGTPTAARICGRLAVHHARLGRFAAAEAWLAAGHRNRKGTYRTEDSRLEVCLLAGAAREALVAWEASENVHVPPAEMWMLSLFAIEAAWMCRDRPTSTLAAELADLDLGGQGRAAALGLLARMGQGSREEADTALLAVAPGNMRYHVRRERSLAGLPVPATAPVRIQGLDVPDEDTMLRAFARRLPHLGDP
ncbi:MAG: hypothetical protein KC621_21570, partial [Myxococcales bacterium]|nr:hypothetical protein [Myxococcales bacterium]